MALAPNDWTRLHTAGPAPRADELLISADSHVIESPTFWADNVPAAFREQAPRFPAPKAREGFSMQLGGSDPSKRVAEMAQDGVSAEVLYPTLGLGLFGLDNAAMQEACFRAYNDWLVEYCSAAPERLWGAALISTYDIEHGIQEMERCRRLGLRSAMIWQVPHPDLPFESTHYERFWAAASDLGMPLSLHIITGHGYSKTMGDLGALRGTTPYRYLVNLKLLEGMDAVLGILGSGALYRNPNLKLLLVENEIGWIPFVFDQWDKYARRWSKVNPLPGKEVPSDYFGSQIFASFFFDRVGAHNLSWWGVDGCLWSNDYPHANTTWPNSREVIARDLGHLPADDRAKLVRLNAARLFGLRIPEPVTV
ncbi:MAG: amidohydrolase family protein [Chloroflexota bacterium]